MPASRKRPVSSSPRPKPSSTPPPARSLHPGRCPHASSPSPGSRPPPPPPSPNRARRSPPAQPRPPPPPPIPTSGRSTAASTSPSSAASRNRSPRPPRSSRAPRRSSPTVQSSWLLPQLAEPLDDFIAEIDETLPDAQLASSTLDALPSILGGEGPRRYFVAFANPAETRFQGGFVASYAELLADNGKVTLERSGPIRELVDVDGSEGRTISNLRVYDERYGRWSAERFFQNTTVSPDWTVNSEVIDQLYPQAGGSEIDGAIYIDPAGLAALLEITGPSRSPSSAAPSTRRVSRSSSPRVSTRTRPSSRTPTARPPSSAPATPCSTPSSPRSCRRPAPSARSWRRPSSRATSSSRRSTPTTTRSSPSSARPAPSSTVRAPTGWRCARRTPARTRSTRTSHVTSPTTSPSTPRPAPSTPR